MKLIEFTINEITSKTGYSSMFKAFIVIITLYLGSTITVTNIALPLEVDSYKLKYSVEHELKKEIEFNELKCKFEMKSYQDCKLALYKNDIKTKSFEALYAFQELLKFLAYLTGILSILGFVIHPYSHEEKNNNKLNPTTLTRSGLD